MTRPDPPQPEDSIHVLHVDDETKQLEFAKTFIEFADRAIHMESVATPKEALERLRDESFDCVISDYQMPQMDGIIFAREIRETSDIPIIIYTGQGSEEVAEAAFTVGVDDYLRKEINPSHYQVLAKRVRTITEKYRSEKQLKDTLAQYQALYDSVSDSITLIDPATYTIISANQATLEYSGMNEKEMISRNCHEVFHGGDSFPVPDCPIERLLETGEPAFTVHQHIGKDGHLRSHEVSVHAIRDVSGEIIQVVRVSRDVTERLEAQEALKGSEEKYRRLVDYAPDAVTTIDLKGYVTSTNAAALKMTGQSEEDVVGKHFTKIGFLRARDIPKYLLMFGAMVRGKEPDLIEIPFTRKDGTQGWAEIHVGFIRNNGSLEGLQIISRDMSKRKKFEEEFVAHERMEQPVEEMSQTLVEAERMAAAGRVAAMVGHDLRGPLQTIKNAIYLMEKNPDTAHELRETINESVNYATSMLEELRLNVGDTPLKLQEVNLGALIRKAVEEASIPDSVEAEVHVDDGLDSVSMDPLKIRRVLDNLIRNAVQAMSEGGTLEVSAVCEGDEVLIRVWDTGTGIPEELMPDLFKAFVTTKPQGMGLGLAYCKRAVEAHGGTIIVESEVGRATSFTVRLP